MAYSRDYRIVQVRQVLDHLAVDKRKAAFALALLAIMGLMWFRVLTGRRPGPAAADTGTSQTPSAVPKPPRNIRYLQLPNLPGRNDYINRDFFAARDWECFRQNSSSLRNPGTEVRAVAPGRAQEVVVRLGQRLKLEAVLKDGRPQAYINDQLLRLGDRITVRDGPDTCEFEVLRIYEDSVLVGCNGTQLTLKLMQHLDVDK
ncbi:MAG: hypothetical protein JW955_25410 [Sedimentisphaerales bacterium]|nr:hypothetical protein [Sedimentisphaerales bacterium]